jgi:hypothetical protein
MLRNQPPPLFGLPKSLPLTISGEGQSRTLVAENVDAQNQRYKFEYQHIYDGQPHPTTNDPNVDSSAYARIGNTVNVVGYKKQVGGAILIPGKPYTYTYDHGQNGELGHDVLV